MDLKKIKMIAFNEFGDKRSSPYNERGDKFTHGERVAKNAVELRKIILPYENDIDDILTVAAWFHDVCNNNDVDRKEHCELGAERTRRLLTKYCMADELNKICEIIAVHDYRKPKENVYSELIKIHQDADLLDHFGTIGIWRFVAYSIGHDSTIIKAARHAGEKRDKYYTKWRSEFNYSESIRVFDDKVRFEKLFFDRFISEVDGGIYGGEQNST